MNKICTRACIYLVLSSAVAVSVAVLVAQTSPTFPPTPSPGDAIQSAARASFAYAQEPTRSGVIEVLGDFQGVDVRRYLHDLHSKVLASWQTLIPADAHTKKGRLAIEFAISKDGSLGQMKFAATSGDTSLDRAAWEGIKAAAPFSAFPADFKGDHLTLRCLFLYNLQASDLAESKVPKAVGDIEHAELIQSVAASNLPGYPKQARSNKVEGIVRLEATIAANGKVKDIKVLEGNPSLAKASTLAIRQWRWHPAKIDNVCVEDVVRIKVEFRLESEKVRAEVSQPEPAWSGKTIQ